MAKKRLDDVLFERKLSRSLLQAQTWIQSGRVIVNNVKLDKIGTLISEDSDIHIIAKKTEYVSRGGDKLASAHAKLKFELRNKIILDVGVSTGGFSDYALENGAAAVYGVDVGYGQVANKLHLDNRMAIIERSNARTLSFIDFKRRVGKNRPNLLKSSTEINMLMMDVSFISALKIIPNILTWPIAITDWIIMIKPQFEATKEELPKGGVIADEILRKSIVDRTVAGLEALGLACKQIADSDVTGPKGNLETFFHGILK